MRAVSILLISAQPFDKFAEFSGLRYASLAQSSINVSSSASEPRATWRGPFIVSALVNLILLFLLSRG